MSSTTKYTGLPDIDTAADVYETEDAPIISRGQNDSDSEDSLKKLRVTTDKKRSETVPGAVDGRSLLPGKERVKQVFGRRERSRNRDSYTRPRLPPLTQRLPSRAHLTDESSASVSSDEDDDDDDDDDDNYLTARTASLRIRETPQARLRRLKWEMSQLEKELQASAVDTVEGEEQPAGRRKGKAPPTAELLKQLAALQSNADNLEGPAAARRVMDGIKPVADTVRGIVHRASRPKEGGSMDDAQDGQVVPGEEQRQGMDTADLDRRLDLLERRIGTGTVDETTLSEPILQSLQKLENVLALLAAPRQLDTAARKVKFLLADLGKASALASGTQTPGVRAGPTTLHPVSTLHVTPSEREKLDAIYALLPRIDPLLPILPPLLTRLRSLSTLHANASSFQATLETLEAQTGEMDRVAGEMRGVLARVEDGLERNAAGVKANWESLEGRLGDLMGRLEVLEREDR